MAATLEASAKRDRVAELAAIDFPALVTDAQVDKIAALYTDHGIYVRLALAILTKDATACHEMATEMDARGAGHSLMDTHAGIKASATWLRKTANMMDKAALRVFAGMARRIKEGGFNDEQEG